MSGVTPPRIGVFSHWPEGRQALRSVGDAARETRVSAALLELVRLHCSVLNGCGYCIAMHEAYCRTLGVPEAQVAALRAGDLVGRFSEREFAALALAGEMTRMDDGAALAEAVTAAKAQFEGQELAVICFQIAAINAWNRLAVADGLEEAHFAARD